MKWQLIATAPKDYSQVLLCRFSHHDDYGSGITVGFWGIQDIGPDKPGQEQWCDWAAGYEYGDGWKCFYPSHWMPLPQPPE